MGTRSTSIFMVIEFGGQFFKNKLSLAR